MKLKRLLTGAVAAGSIALAAQRVGSLSNSGALAATAVGMCVYTGLGMQGTAVMLGFFIPSSLLSKLAKNMRPAQTLAAKDSPRDAGQVLANGGLAALFALYGTHAWARLAFASALASASSDTWSTEIGTAFGGRPVHLLTQKPAISGLSGNVSNAGFVGALCGSAWIATLAGLGKLAHPLPVFVGGVAGGLVDSLLGATVQALYRCGRCNTFYESPKHCDTDAVLVHGIAWIDNDAVNTLSILAAIGLAALANPCGAE